MTKTVAEQFSDTLAAAGVKRIYGIVGDSLNPHFPYQLMFW
jgi:pyruvate dehydrogenase (quinone)